MFKCKRVFMTLVLSIIALMYVLARTAQAQQSGTMYLQLNNTANYTANYDPNNIWGVVSAGSPAPSGSHITNVTLLTIYDVAYQYHVGSINLFHTGSGSVTVVNGAFTYGTPTYGASVSSFNGKSPNGLWSATLYGGFYVSPSSVTVRVDWSLPAPPPPAPPYGGSIDGVFPYIGGWAWRGDQPNNPVNVDVYIDGVKVATVPAANYRPDLQPAGIGNGYHGYTWQVPITYYDGYTHQVDVYCSDSPVLLRSSGVSGLFNY